MVRTFLASVLLCGLCIFSGCGGDSQNTTAPAAPAAAKGDRDSGGLGAAMKEKAQGATSATPPADGAAPADAAAPAPETPAQP
jgi:hypothetical protein